MQPTRSHSISFIFDTLQANNLGNVNEGTSAVDHSGLSYSDVCWWFVASSMFHRNKTTWEHFITISSDSFHYFGILILEQLQLLNEVIDYPELLKWAKTATSNSHAINQVKMVNDVE